MFGIDDFSQQANIQLLKESLDKPSCVRIICVSESVKLSLAELGVNQEKLITIYNGLDVESVEIAKKSTEKTIDIIYVGKLEPVKGTTLLLNSLKLLKEKFPQFKCLIVGQGREDDSIQSLIKIFGLEENITVLPSLKNGKLVKAISESRVLVSTSYSESFGLAIAEAMLAGTPVVVPNIEGPLEVIDNGNCGLFYNQGDTGDICLKLVKALSMEQTELTELTSKAKKFATDNFNLKDKAIEFANLVTEVT